MKHTDPRRIAPLHRVHVPPADAPLVGWRPLLVQVLLFVGAAVSYFAVRNLTQGSEATADANAGHLVSLERRLGIDWESALQGLIIDHGWLVALVNWIYIYGHWPLIGITLVVLFLRAPAEYRILRNAMFISGGIGLVIFAMYPVAPPRFGALDVLDTVTDRSDSYRTLQPPGLINKYAALPSLHFGWNLLVGIVIWRVASSHLLKAFAVVIPVAMAFAVVVTGNHYVADVVAGGAVALVGLACAMVIASAPAPAPSDRVGT
jgi:hypothetical protein